MDDKVEFCVQMDSNDCVLDYLIVGGGVAGLSAANHLAENGMAPVLLDGGDFPSHKVCGEFFSPDCHLILRRWGLLPQSEIKKVRFHLGGQTFPFALPLSARGESRFQFDRRLLERAEAFGAKVYTNKKVVKIEYLPNEPCRYRTHLEGGEVFASKKLIVGTGRVARLLFPARPQEMRYVGLKAHFEGVELAQTLEMFLLPGGYLGASPIEAGKINIAGLFQKEAVESAGGAEKYLESSLSNPLGEPLKRLFARGRSLFPKWMAAEIPGFHRVPPDTGGFEELYLVGDAAAAIPPASGAGIGMAVTSGWMAADFSLRGIGGQYQRAWIRTYRSRLRWASLVHWLMLNPSFGGIALKTSALFPPLFQVLFSKTRGK